VKSSVVLGLGFTLALLSTPLGCNGAVQPPPPNCIPSPGTICGIFAAYKLPGKMPHGFNFGRLRKRAAISDEAVGFWRLVGNEKRLRCCFG